MIQKNIDLAWEHQTYKADLLCEEDLKRLNELVVDIDKNYTGDKKRDLKKNKIKKETPFNLNKE